MRALLPGTSHRGRGFRVIRLAHTNAERIRRIYDSLAAKMGSGAPKLVITRLDDGLWRISKRRGAIYVDPRVSRLPDRYLRLLLAYLLAHYTAGQRKKAGDILGFIGNVLGENDENILKKDLETMFTLLMAIQVQA